MELKPKRERFSQLDVCLIFFSIFQMLQIFEFWIFFSCCWMLYWNVKQWTQFLFQFPWNEYEMLLIVFFLFYSALDLGFSYWCRSWLFPEMNLLIFFFHKKTIRNICVHVCELKTCIAEYIQVNILCVDQRKWKFIIIPWVFKNVYGICWCSVHTNTSPSVSSVQYAVRMVWGFQKWKQKMHWSEWIYFYIIWGRFIV